MRTDTRWYARSGYAEHGIAEQESFGWSVRQIVTIKDRVVVVFEREDAVFEGWEARKTAWEDR